MRHSRTAELRGAEQAGGGAGGRACAQTLDARTVRGEGHERPRGTGDGLRGTVTAGHSSKSDADCCGARVCWAARCPLPVLLCFVHRRQHNSRLPYMADEP